MRKIDYDTFEIIGSEAYIKIFAKDMYTVEGKE